MELAIVNGALLVPSDPQFQLILHRQKRLHEDLLTSPGKTKARATNYDKSKNIKQKPKLNFNAGNPTLSKELMDGKPECRLRFSTHSIGADRTRLLL